MEAVKGRVGPVLWVEHARRPERAGRRFLRHLYSSRVFDCRWIIVFRVSDNVNKSQEGHDSHDSANKQPNEHHCAEDAGSAISGLLLLAFVGVLAIVATHGYLHQP